eukprot:10289711-Alexandrium_andersonii.AAC.1
MGTAPWWCGLVWPTRSRARAASLRIMMARSVSPRGGASSATARWRVMLEPGEGGASSKQQGGG